MIPDKINYSALTRVMSLQVNDTDTVWLVRYLNGNGAHFKFFDSYVIRNNQKFLGRFEVQQKPSQEANWDQSSDFKLPENEIDAFKKNIELYRKARWMMIGMAEKVW